MPDVIVCEHGGISICTPCYQLTKHNLFGHTNPMVRDNDERI